MTPYYFHPARPEKFSYSTASIGPGVLKLCMNAGIDYADLIAKHLLNEKGELTDAEVDTNEENIRARSGEVVSRYRVGERTIQITTYLDDRVTYVELLKDNMVKQGGTK